MPHFSFFSLVSCDFFSSRFLHLLFQIFFLLFLNNLFFCLNLLFHLRYFRQNSLKLFHDCFNILLHLPHIREYQNCLNIILNSNTIVYHYQHDHLNLKYFFHHLKRTTQSCWYEVFFPRSFKFEVFFPSFKMSYTIMLI